MLDCQRLYAGTDDGLRVLAPDGTRVAGVDGGPVRDLSVHPGDPEAVLFGRALGGHGLYRTTDGGASATRVGFADRWVWGVDRHPADPETVYVGTEPPALFRSTDGGATFAEVSGIHDVAGREDWRFGYEPYEAGHVHGVAAHPDRPDRLFAAVEVGGLLVSEDGGETWRAERVGADAHRTLVDPSDPDHVVATTETGLVESHDGGRSWRVVDPTAGQYLKCVRVGPAGIYALGGADMGAETVTVYADEGDGWTATATYEPAGVTAFAVVGDRVVLQGADGRLGTAPADGSGRWRPVGPELATCRCLRAV